MSIELTFMADTYSELMQQVSAFVRDPVEAPEAVERKPELKPKKRSVGAILAETAPPPQEVFEQEDPIVDEVQAEAPKGAKELLDLKARMLITLQAAGAEGKIGKLRAILHTYGGGAKSFPEVAPVQFVEIEKAVQEGALA